MEYKLPPLPFAVFDEFGKSCEDRVCDHFIAAIEAQGVPDDADVWCEYVAEMVGAYISEPVGSEKVKAIAGIIRRRMPQRFFASAPPAPQAERTALSAREIWDDDAIMTVNADAQIPFETIERFVRAIEAAHGIQGS